MKFTKEQRKIIDYMYKSLKASGYDDVSISGIIGNALTESSLDPDSTSDSKTFHGLFQNDKNIKLAVIDKYGDYSIKSLMKYAHDWVSGADWVRLNKYTLTNAGKFKRAGYKNAHEASDAWMRLYERPVIVDNAGNVIGYQRLDLRRANATAMYDYINTNYNNIRTATTDKGKEITIPITAYQDLPQYESTYQLPKQTNTIYPLNPKDRTVSSLDAWNGTDSPSAGPNMPSLQKSMDERKRMFDLFSDNAIAVGKKKTLPDLRNVLDRKMEDYIPGIMGVPDVYEEPGYTYTPMIYSPMPVFADGKLPKFEIGKPDDDIIRYTKNGAQYNVNKNVVGAKELSVTTPDVNVVGTDKRPMYQRYDAEHSAYDPNAIREFTDLAPVIGDIGYSLDAYNAFKNLDYLQAGILGGMVLMPNALSYAGKRIVKPILNKMRFVDDGQKDLGVMLGTTVGGGIIGSQIVDEDNKLNGLVVGTGAGTLLGAARGLTRSILRDSSSKVYLPYKMRPYMDWFLDPYETAVAKYHGYYGKTPTKLELYDTAYKHSLYAGADLKLAGNIAQEVVDNTNLLTEPEYILKNGTNSIGMYFPLENTIDVMVNRRNSLLPPKNVMGYNNPVLGTYSHEMNHYMNNNYKYAKDRLSMSGNFTDPITGEASEMYYVPNDLYFDKQFVDNYKKALGDKWKKNNWIGSPEEMLSEIVNYLTLHDKDYMSLSKDQKNELFDLISRRFNMKKEDVVGLVDHIGSYHFSGANK